MPYLSDTKYGKLFPFKLVITDAAFEYEGLPGEHAIVTIPEGYITPDDYRLSLAGKDLPLKNFVAFTPYEQLIMTINQQDGRLLLPVDIDGSISIDVSLAGRIGEVTSSGTPLVDIRGKITGGKNFTIAGVYFNEMQFATHFDMASKELVLDELVISPGSKERDYRLSVENMVLYQEGVGFVPNGTLKLRGNDGKSTRRTC